MSQRPDDYVDRKYYQQNERLPRSKWKAEHQALVLSTMPEDRWRLAFSKPPEVPENPCPACRGTGFAEEVKLRHAVRIRICEVCGGGRTAPRGARADGANSPLETPAQAAG